MKRNGMKMWRRNVKGKKKDTKNEERRKEGMENIKKK